MDDLQFFERWDDPNFTSPEPIDDPFWAGLFDQTDAIASECRVVLSGEGIDNLMHFQMWPYVRTRIRRREWRSALRDVARYWRMRPSIWPSPRNRNAGREFQLLGRLVASARVLRLLPHKDGAPLGSSCDMVERDLYQRANTTGQAVSCSA